MAKTTDDNWSGWKNKLEDLADQPDYFPAINVRERNKPTWAPPGNAHKDRGGPHYGKKGMGR